MECLAGIGWVGGGGCCQPRQVSELLRGPEVSVLVSAPFLGKPREHEPVESSGSSAGSASGDSSFESSDSLLQSWNSQSSLLDVQRVPSFESFEDDAGQSLCLGKPTMSFKDYIQECSDPAEQGKPVIPAAVLAGFTGEGTRGARMLLASRAAGVVCPCARVWVCVCHSKPTHPVFPIINRPVWHAVDCP